MMANHAAAGRVDWIGLRAERLAKIDVVDAAEVNASGLIGDHGRAGKRAVTLIQAEHLPVIAALAGRGSVAPEELRRNIVVSCINLQALRKAPLHIGDLNQPSHADATRLSRANAEEARLEYHRQVERAKR